jgi:hypothetical protein
VAIVCVSYQSVAYHLYQLVDGAAFVFSYARKLFCARTAQFGADYYMAFVGLPGELFCVL